MSRRPKLSLSPDNSVDKRQAPGFEAAAAFENRESSTPTATEESSHENRAGRESVSEDARTVQQATTWPVGMRFVKVALVMVAAVLSLYLLKRRLM